MKKLSFSLLFFFLCSFSFASQYKIKNADYNVTAAGFKFLGKTNKSSIEIKFPINKTTLFQSEEELNNYINAYINELMNSRAFESIDYILGEQVYFSDIDCYEVSLLFNIQDSHHFLIMPYPKFSTNDGFSMKAKIKDSNFLGSLNTLSAEGSFQIDTQGRICPGFLLDYILPFKIGNATAEWVNDYTLTYTSGYAIPEWNLKTGFTILFPFNNLGLKIEAYQYFINSLLYKKFNDNMHFMEQAIISLPITVYHFDTFTKLIYTPLVSGSYYWDIDGLDEKNTDLASPSLTLGHSLSSSKINWIDCFRLGFNASLTNKFTYNFKTTDFIPYIGFETKLYYTFITSEKRDFFEQFGIAIDFYAFGYLYSPGNKLDYGERIGPRLRGCPDYDFYGNITPLYTTSAAIIFSMDLPHHIFTTDFKHEILNFNFQISPFFDAALIYNRVTNDLFSLKQGLYCAGVEFLVYPLKWSSYTIRASAGYDIKKLLKGEGSLLSRLKKPEIYIGLGLQY